MQRSRPLSDAIEGSADAGSGKLLFVVDLDLKASSLDLVLDILLRARALSTRAFDISITCLYARDADRALLDQYLSAEEQGRIQIYLLRKETQQLAPGMMSQVCLNAYLFYQWLKSQPVEFDLVHAADANNLLYFALVAKSLGMHFLRSGFVHMCLSPILHSRDASHQPVENFVDLAQIYMERQSFVMADHIQARSSCLLAWLGANGYPVERDAVRVLPPLLTSPQSNPASAGRESGRSGFVYLGDLRDRSDWLIYLDAFKRLKRACGVKAIPLSSIDILIVSERKPTKAATRAIQSLFEGSGISWSIQVANHFEFADSERLAGKLLLLPVHQSEPGLVALKLLGNGNRILGIADSGLEDLCTTPDFKLVKPHPHAMSEAMLGWLSGDESLPGIAYKASEVVEQYEQWYQAVLSAEVTAKAVSDNTPLVSVCVAHFNRPGELQQALSSISQLEYRNLEVIIVDDGSTAPEALQYLQTVEDMEFPFDVRLFTQPNLYLGASRNLAARHARGKYMLFMDDDNLAKPEEISVLVAAAEYSQADILTCFADAFLRDDELASKKPRNRIVFTGPDLAAGFFRNPYGDSNCLVRKESFDRLGGFSEDYKIGRDDQEFFSRSILNGYRLQVVPEALYWYKINTTRMRQTQFSQYAGLRRVARPYYEQSGLDPFWLDMLRYAQGLSAQKSGLTNKGLRRLTQNNRLRRIAYAFPGLYKWLRPLLQRF